MLPNSRVMGTPRFPAFETLEGVPEPIYHRLHALWMDIRDNLSLEENVEFCNLVPRAKLGRSTRTIANQCIAQRLKANPEKIGRAHYHVLHEIFGSKALLSRNGWPVFRSRFPEEAEKAEGEASYEARVRRPEAIPCATPATNTLRPIRKRKYAEEPSTCASPVKKREVAPVSAAEDSSSLAQTANTTSHLPPFTRPRPERSAPDAADGVLRTENKMLRAENAMLRADLVLLLDIKSRNKVKDLKTDKDALTARVKEMDQVQQQMRQLLGCVCSSPEKETSLERQNYSG